MTPESDRYALRGGEWGRDRLAILARDRWPDTSALLAEIGVRPGTRCADVGCGGGAVAVELAKWVGPHGHVVAIDRDAVKLKLARQSARASLIGNLEYRELPISDWTESESYDLVYSRFLLQHLTSPEGALRRMWAAVRPGGTLAIEDVDHEGWSSDPPSRGIDFLRQGLQKAIGTYGGDARVGRRLVDLFGSAGIPAPTHRKVERGTFAPENTILAPLTLESIRESLLGADPHLGAEFEDAMKSLHELVAAPDPQIHGPTLYQVYARKDPRGASAQFPPRGCPRGRDRPRLLLSAAAGPLDLGSRGLEA